MTEDEVARGMASNIAKRNTVPLSIVAIGDSTTANISQSFPNDIVSYSQFLAWMGGWNVVNKGVSGNTIGDVFNRLQSDVIALNPKFCIILIGVNDALGSMTSVANYATRVREITNMLLSAGITPVWCSVLPSSFSDNTKFQLIISYNRYLQYWCLTQGLLFVDLYPSFIDSSGAEVAGLLYDHLHPNGLGTKTIANAIYTVMSNFLPSYRSSHYYGEAYIFNNNLFILDTNSDGLADSWYKEASAGTTATPSLIAHPRMGNWQQLAKSASTNATDRASLYAELFDSGSGANWSVGCTLDISLDVDTDANLNGCEWYVDVVCQDASYAAISITTLGGYPSVASVSDTRIFGSVVVPALTAHIWLYFRIKGQNAATARIGNVVSRKRTW